MMRGKNAHYSKVKPYNICFVLEIQQSLHALPDSKAHRVHRHNLEVPDTKSHEEALRATSRPNRAHRLSPAQPTPRLCQPANLHSSAHHLERVRNRLREDTR